MPITRDATRNPHRPGLESCRQRHFPGPQPGRQARCAQERGGERTRRGAKGDDARRSRADARATRRDRARRQRLDRYDIVRDGLARIGRSPDPDARPETRAHFVDLSTAVDLIHRSLARGQSVVWGSNENHPFLIYGADYDPEGRALAYWVKDSFAPYSYRAPRRQNSRGADRRDSRRGAERGGVGLSFIVMS